MILVLKKEITEEQKSIIQSTLFEQGCIVREITGAGQNVIGAVGRRTKDVQMFEKLPGVEKSHSRFNRF